MKDLTTNQRFNAEKVTNIRYKYFEFIKLNDMREAIQNNVLRSMLNFKYL
jgi:hypothetical protein